MRMKTYTLKQFTRFVLVGILNTCIDFVILNLLIWQFTISRSDLRFTYFKIISFMIASINSFLLNKLWVFKRKNSSEKGRKVEMLSFAVISLIGLFLNASIAYIVFISLHTAGFGTNTQLLANVGALAGTLTVLLFNFFTYKLFIFKSKEEEIAVS